MKVGDCSFLYCSSTLLICNFCAWELYKLSLLCFSQCPFRTDYDFRIPFRTAYMEKFSPSERTITSLSLDPMSQWADHSKKQFARWCHPMVFGGGSSTLRNLVLVCQQQQVELAGFGKGCLCVCVRVLDYTAFCAYMHVNYTYHAAACMNICCQWLVCSRCHGSNRCVSWTARWNAALGSLLWNIPLRCCDLPVETNARARMFCAFYFYIKSLYFYLKKSLYL